MGCIFAKKKIMRVYVSDLRTTVKVYETGVETPKAILCRVYWEEDHSKAQMWIPKSQIEERGHKRRSFNDEEYIELSVWYFAKVLKGRIYKD